MPYANIEDRKAGQARWYKNVGRAKWKEKYYSTPVKERSEHRRAEYLRNKPAINARHNQYRKDNPEVGRASIAKRKALQKQLVPEKLKDCADEYKKLKCFYELAQQLYNVDKIFRHVDHIWPLSDGGPHWSGNLQILTQEENLRKGKNVCPDDKKRIQNKLKKAGLSDKEENKDE
tara:strand:- start:39 stop:563 length:525 start_codon:yes stop_codon:yes gene_type:complete